MRAKTLILFIIAIGCGLAASMGVSQYLERASGNSARAVETTKIFVAVTDINIGTKLDTENVRLEEWPKDRVPEGAITTMEELAERFPRTRLYAGEPVLRAKLMDSNDGSKSVDIPEGFRVVSVRVSMESSVSGLVQPGDRVDLVVFLRKSADVPETGTRTILKDVNVFAVDAETERNVDPNGVARDLRTVSLLVKPSQAEAVMLASEMGQLCLSLRRPNDGGDDDSQGITVRSLFGTYAEFAGDKPESDAAPNPTAGIVQWLTQAAAQASQPDAKAARAATSAEPAWKMQILTSDGYREFRWHDPKEMPSEVVVGADGPATTAESLEPIAPAPVSSPKSETEATSGEDPAVNVDATS